MKRVFILSVLLLLLTHSHAQALTHEQRLADLGRVWGFLKYFHPSVAGGQYNWDSVLIRKIDAVGKLSNAEMVNVFYNQWLDELGTIKQCHFCKPYSDEDIVTAGLNWLKQDGTMNAALRARFIDILQNRYHGNAYYIENKKAGNIEMMHEPAYADMAYPSMNYRLLGLFRHWNVIQYFFPYKKDIGEDWNKVLDEMIIPFRDAADTLAYHAALWQLAARINDSHSNGICAAYIPSCGSPLFGTMAPPFVLKWVEKQAVVSRIIADSLCAVDDIRVGDVIKEINGRAVQQVIDANWPYIGGSNENGRYRNAVVRLLLGHTPATEIITARNGKLTRKNIHRYTWDYIRSVATPRKMEMWKLLEEGVGYIEMGNLKPDSVNYIMSALKDTRAIIIDVRNYPQNTAQQIIRFTHPAATPFVYFTSPQPNKPGLFERGKDFLCGSNNKQPYKGKIILLVDERTQSHAEFSVMTLQTAPAVITIGSQTAGADGNVSTIIFPGGYSVLMSGIGVYYPDGGATQRVGVRIDIPVKPTLEAVINNRDEILERALQYLHTGN